MNAPEKKPEAALLDQLREKNPRSWDELSGLAKDMFAESYSEAFASLLDATRPGCSLDEDKIVSEADKSSFAKKIQFGAQIIGNKEKGGGFNPSGDGEDQIARAYKCGDTVFVFFDVAVALTRKDQEWVKETLDNVDKLVVTEKDRADIPAFEEVFDIVRYEVTSLSMPKNKELRKDVKSKLHELYKKKFSGPGQGT